jgi:hypothetical protein
MSKQRNLRKKRPAEDEPEDGDDGTPEVKKELLQDLKLLQKLRKRTAGVDANKLIPAAEYDEDEAADNELMDAQYVKAVEDNRSQILDEKVHMEQFVERELARRLGKAVDEGEQHLSKQERQERELYQMPEGFEVGVLSTGSARAVLGGSGLSCCAGVVLCSSCL